MPNASPKLNSIPETQTITVLGLQRARKATLKYVYPVATATIFTEVTIDADMPGKLSDDRVSLTFVVNDVAAVTVPITSTAAEFDDAIEAALGGSFMLDDVLFGVRKVSHNSLLISDVQVL